MLQIWTWKAEARNREFWRQKNGEAIQQFNNFSLQFLLVFIQKYSFNLEAGTQNPDTWEFEENSSKFRGFCRSVLTLTIVVPHDPLSPIPSTSSAMKTPDPQSPGLSASLWTLRVPENIEWDPYNLETTYEGDIQVEYYSD